MLSWIMLAVCLFSVCVQPWKRLGSPGVQLNQGGRWAVAQNQGDQARPDCFPHGDYDGCEDDEDDDA